ncbi:MAG: polysaccharide biosynthesis tyrosine autokinase [Bacteroidota bacterium]|nr:polysaccharide biosynthesis tyrosine autokinase [Bacteroidota bacterium]
MEDKELFSGSSSGGLTIKEHLRKYLSYYPLFIISVIICLGLGLLYLRYAVPNYRVTTLLFVKKDNSTSSTDLIKTAVTGEPIKSPIDNEIQLLNSNSLMQRVVSKHGLNISYYHIGKLRDVDIYLNAPFRLIPQEIRDSGKTLNVKLLNINNEGGTLSMANESQEPAVSSAKDKMIKMSFKWNMTFRAGANSFSLVKHGEIPAKDQNYIATWSPIGQAAAEIENGIDINLLDKKTSIIVLGISIENVSRGQDILNGLAAEYTQSDIEDRNVISQNTIRFIDDRLSGVTADLTGVEGKLENYQGNKGLIDVNAQSSQSFANSNNLNNELADNSIKQQVAQSIMKYFNNPTDQDRLVPSTLGLEDPTLSNLIASYNELQLRKQKEAPSLAENGIILRDLNNQLNAVKGSILESLQNINGNLRQKENSLQQQNGQYKQFLSALPSNERAMQEIKRKQSITQGLYLYLLQKREEAAVSSTSSNVPNYKQIDPAMSMGLMSPDGPKIKIYSLLLGLIFPFGIIYIRDLLNDKIMTRKDITGRIDIPIVGEVSHLSRKQSEGISVMERDVVGEEFRLIRTSLYFLLEKKDKQVILITSGAGGEGKSLVSLNLAAVLAIPGKKVALMELDMRKPAIATRLKIKSARGLSDYFNGGVKNLSEIAIQYEEIPTLDIYPSGAIPQFAGDLFLSKKISDLFFELRSKYDYIIVDSPPVGLVSDGLMIGEYADTVLFMVRQRFTQKKQLEFISELVYTNKLRDVGIIFNDVKKGGKVGYYGYGKSFGKYYGEEAKSKTRLSIRKRPKPLPA